MKIEIYKSKNQWGKIPLPVGFWGAILLLQVLSWAPGADLLIQSITLATLVATPG